MSLLKHWLDEKKYLKDYRLRIGRVVFHIPYDGKEYLHFHCERCGFCCRSQPYGCLLLTARDIKRLSAALKYPSIEAFLEKECILATIREREVYPIIGYPPVKATYTGYFLKRTKDENEESITKPHRCRFLTRRNLCSIYDERPIVCRKFPYTIYMDVDGFLHAYYVVTPKLKCSGYRSKPVLKRKWFAKYVKILIQSYIETAETVDMGLMTIDRIQ